MDGVKSGSQSSGKTTLYWKLSGSGVEASDFSSPYYSTGQLQGDGTIGSEKILETK